MKRNMFEFTLPLEKNTRFLEIIALLLLFLRNIKETTWDIRAKKDWRFDFVKLFCPFVFASAKKYVFRKTSGKVLFW